MKIEIMVGQFLRQGAWFFRVAQLDFKILIKFLYAISSLNMNNIGAHHRHTMQLDQQLAFLGMHFYFFLVLLRILNI